MTDIAKVCTHPISAMLMIPYTIIVIDVYLQHLCLLVFCMSSLIFYHYITENLAKSSSRSLPVS